MVAPETWEPLRTRKRRTRKAPVTETGEEKPLASSKDAAYWLEVFGDESSEKE